MKLLIKKFARDESGATAIEYGLIAVLVSVVLIAGARLLGTNLNALFNFLATTVAERPS